MPTTVIVALVAVVALLIVFARLRAPAGGRQGDQPVLPYRPAAREDIAAPEAPIQVGTPAGLGERADSPIARTLESLRQVDDHPLFTMTYYGAYEAPLAARLLAGGVGGAGDWACSLFVAFADTQRAIYGRNFDWDADPALLLFTDPPDGYAAVSMVDIRYLGFNRRNVSALASWQRRRRLLRAPLLPFDGMNEHGLTVGMASVGPSSLPRDPRKPTVGGLYMIRLMLDHARTTDEAITLLKQYNVAFRGGPPIHYLIADPTGHSAVAEFKDRKVYVIPNDQPWQSATNFYLAGTDERTRRRDWRYQTAAESLEASEGTLGREAAMDLLRRVAQYHTRWSIVYEMSTREIHIATSRRYDRVHTFQLPTGA